MLRQREDDWSRCFGREGEGWEVRGRQMGGEGNVLRLTTATDVESVTTNETTFKSYTKTNQITRSIDKKSKKMSERN